AARDCTAPKPGERRRERPGGPEWVVGGSARRRGCADCNGHGGGAPLATFSPAGRGKGDRRRLDLALSYLLDQRARRRIRSDRQLGAQQRRQLPRPTERGVAAAVARDHLERDALAILAGRVERDQPLGRRQGTLAVAGRIRGGGLPLEHARRHAGEALLLALAPGRELLRVEREIGEEPAAPQRGCAGDA